MNTYKGFTLIELLVVIAIIGILASVVLAALSSARSKGSDAAIQSQLSSMRSQAELYYSTSGNNSYGTGQTTPAYATPTVTSSALSCASGTNMFNGTTVTNNLSKLNNAITTAKDCGASATAWSVAAQGQTVTIFYCVDSTGVSRSKNTGGNTYTGLVGTDLAPAYFAHQAIAQATCS